MNTQETACVFDIENEKLIWVEIGNNRSNVASVDKANIEETKGKNENEIKDENKDKEKSKDDNENKDKKLEEKNE